MSPRPWTLALAVVLAIAATAADRASARTGANPAGRMVLPISSGATPVSDALDPSGTHGSARSNGAAPHSTSRKLTPSPRSGAPPGNRSGAGAPHTGAAVSRPLERSTHKTTGMALLDSAPSPHTVMAVPVSLPAGAVQLDSTWWDHQDFGSLGTRITVGADGRVHVAWQDDHCDVAPGGCPPNPSNPEVFPRRGMAYAFRNVTGGWNNLGRVQEPAIRGCCADPTLSGGYGTLALTPSGRAVISQDTNEDGCDLRSGFYLQSTPGASLWNAHLPPPSDFLFPQIAALPNGGFAALAEIPNHGDYDRTNRVGAVYLGAPGNPYTCFQWQLPDYAEFIPGGTFPDGTGAFPSLASASDGRAGIAITDFGGNVFLIESTNATFQPSTIRVRNLTNYSPAMITASDSTSTQWRPYLNSHLAYRDTIPHVVWSELHARRIGANVEYFDWRSRIRHWSSTTGVSTVYQVQPGEADRYDDLDHGLDGPIAGFNTISVDWPQVGFSPGGFETYVIWQRHVDAEIDPTANAGLPGIITGVGFGDIAGSLRRTGGAWTAPQNLTQTPQTDERFPSVAGLNERGHLRLLFQASATNQAGVAVVGDRGGVGCGPTGCTTELLVRRIAYLERHLTASVVAVESPAAPSVRAAISTHPNPARGAVRFTIDPLRVRAGAAVLVFSASGRRVARIPAGGAAATWEGRDDDGRSAPPGLYFARLESDTNAPGAKFMLLR